MILPTIIIQQSGHIYSVNIYGDSYKTRLRAEIRLFIQRIRGLANLSGIDTDGCRRRTKENTRVDQMKVYGVELNLVLCSGTFDPMEILVRMLLASYCHSWDSNLSPSSIAIAHVE